MDVAEFDYNLPNELIAQTPLEPRDSARLLVLERRTGVRTHRVFREIGAYLRPGDLLVANDTRVMPARVWGHKAGTGGKVELLLLAPADDARWEVLMRGHGLRPGARVVVDVPEGVAVEPVEVAVEEVRESGTRVVRFSRPPAEWLDTLGHIPLPPYIHAPLADPTRYQTVFARREGAAAAPTAGLHFTPELLFALRDQGVQTAFVTLHIGLDTFRPVEVARVEDHPIHTEWCQLTPEVAAQINETKLAGGRVIAVGTTAVRVLETAARAAFGQMPVAEAEVCPWRAVSAFSGPTNLYIYPGFRYRVVDALVTNFHLPRSSLLMLVAAFAGLEPMRAAYAEAVALRYRFFSFGDAMFIA